MVKNEFGLFPHQLWRPKVPFLEGELPPHLKDPWARRDAWRYHSFFSLKNRVRLMLPGFGMGITALGAYILYDQWYHTKGPGAEEAKHWKQWMEEREKRLGHGHGHDGHH
nr:hypothetical protein HK105_007835 [Polyrhizophydium stewartii]